MGSIWQCSQAGKDCLGKPRDEYVLDQLVFLKGCSVSKAFSENLARSDVHHV